MADYDRYEKFRADGGFTIVPFVRIPKKDTDFFELYKRGETRLDILSNKYYKNPNYAWLIMQANPQFGSMEYEIPDGATLRIPYPLGLSLDAYSNEIDKYNEIY